MWFCSRNLSQDDLQNIAELQLVTWSCDQGWADDRSKGSWTWFDLGFFPSIPYSAEDPDRKQKVMSWLQALPNGGKGNGSLREWHPSHRNPVADGALAWRAGRIFGRDKKLWGRARSGDVLAVRACAQFSGWENKAERGELRVWKWFESVI